MNKAIENLVETQAFAMKVRPKVGGFPYLAEAFRAAGITRNLWSLPSCQSVYYTKYGAVVQQGSSLIPDGMSEIAKFNKEALIRALRADQEGKSTFSEFLKSSWEAGVVGYDVDFMRRTVTYYGVLGESYVEEYPAVDLGSEN
ncbi:MAG: DUF1398 family protein [Oligoflexia bacterium]|nr:DUF1398 family protein [Oligoflexia bacterium]